ncbi:hypothetical protein Taro_037636, partial [Colocasia esculenta]|nr:hypothetical protein [Colocasia esculenta]
NFMLKVTLYLLSGLIFSKRIISVSAPNPNIIRLKYPLRIRILFGADTNYPVTYSERTRKTHIRSVSAPFTALEGREERGAHERDQRAAIQRARKPSGLASIFSLHPIRWPRAWEEGGGLHATRRGGVRTQEREGEDAAAGGN